jgi:serpin B
MPKWIAAAAAVFVAGVAFAVRNKPPAPDAPFAPSAPSPAQPAPKFRTGRADAALVKRLVAANTDFGFRLFSRLVAKNMGENVFFSPYSVTSALAMTYNGATDETEQAMAKTLGITGMPLADVDRAHAQLAMSLLKPDKDIRLNVANSLWGSKGLAFKPEFLQDNRDYFGAEIATVDFTQPQAAADRINGWVHAQTEGKINNLVKPESLTDKTALQLVNAVYFQGVWLHRFDPDTTKDAPFTLADGSKVATPMMHGAGQEDYRYLSGKDFQAVRLPYGTDPFSEGRFAMYVFLPNRPDGLPAWLKRLTPEAWDGCLKEMKPTGGTVVLPKFHVEYEAEMSRPLAEMGMNIAFDPYRARFRRMLDNQVYIKRVDHKALLEVDEKGTVAAASTSVQMELTSLVIRRHPFKMVVDHPFFCAIRYDETGEVLFMGAVWRPDNRDGP